ncbi:MAG: fused MFS/spermidine synthase [Micavibrio sp.]|nr:fused MFS/spermidine synthase [Micavibrio sp.]
MFALQPMVGKMLLPVVGGTPAGWIVAMAFFQVMLLLGYLLAHALAALPPRAHGFAYILCLVTGLYFLPVHITADAAISTAGPVKIFLLLCANVAIPFIALSASASTLQRLFTTIAHASAKDPYFLYAASNLGSFIGLFLYPLVFEPLWGLSLQSVNWRGGFATLIVATIICISFAKRTTPAVTKAEVLTKENTGGKNTRRQRLEWLLLAFFPSALLSAVTTHISTDIFSAPMIWVLPLALYLLTFVVAFSGSAKKIYAATVRLHRIAVPLGVGMLGIFNASMRISVGAMLFHLFVFTVVALVCHCQLAQKRPPGDEKNGRKLTEFYFFMSLGGALGGILNAFIIPFVFDRLIEYPVLLILSCVMNPAFRKKMDITSRMFLGLSLFISFMYLSYITGNTSIPAGSTSGSLPSSVVVADVMLLSISVIMATSIRGAFYGGIALLLMAELIVPRDIVMTTRNFYGVVKVFDIPQMIDGKERTVRFMYHGTTTHGYQVQDPAYARKTTAYYWAGGPVEDIFAVYNPRNIAILGLGVGTMNCFSTKESQFTFFEIDDAVRSVAEKEFTFLTACTGKRPPRIVIGDGRLELAKTTGEKFNLIALDAFSSDTIPTHLLTVDAVKTYLSRLSDGGIILFNLSNRYFVLSKPLQRIADALNLKTRVILDIPPPSATYATASLWFVMARPGASLSPLDDYGWIQMPEDTSSRLWTDDYTNLLGVTRLF